MAECNTAVAQIDLTKVKPYGDTLNDGMTEVAFTLPVPYGDEANEAAKILAKKMGLGHAFEMDPEIENGFLYELAQAIMAREIFPKCPLKYMPPTKYMTGNIFKGNVQDALFNMIAIWSGQSLQLLGMLTEAIHTPHMHDRYLSIENAQYIFNNMRDIGSEVYYKEGGIILLDNMLWYGRVVDLECNHDTVENQLRCNREARIIHKLNQDITDDERVDNILLPFRDGIMMCRVR